jgi:hypothetical protein
MAINYHFLIPFNSKYIGISAGYTLPAGGESVKGKLVVSTKGGQEFIPPKADKSR